MGPRPDAGAESWRPMRGSCPDLESGGQTGDRSERRRADAVERAPEDAAEARAVLAIEIGQRDVETEEPPIRVDALRERHADLVALESDRRAGRVVDLQRPGTERRREVEDASSAEAAERTRRSRRCRSRHGWRRRCQCRSTRTLAGSRRLPEAALGKRCWQSREPFRTRRSRTRPGRNWSPE